MQIGRYQIQEEIARGGMGVVLRAYDPAAGRTLAIKVILGGGFSPTARARFAREAKALASVRHPRLYSWHA